MTRNRPDKPASTPGPNLPPYGSITKKATVATSVIPAVMNSQLQMGRQAWLRARPKLSSSAATGVPEFPRAWIIQTARHKAIDRIRRRTRLEEKLESYAQSELSRTIEQPDYDTNEGYAATRGEPLVKADICAEAIRLGRLVATLMTPEPPAEATALLALMLLHDSGRDARLDEAGDIVLHAGRADLLRRIGSSVEAAKSYARALELVTNDSERRFLKRRLREVQPPKG